ncbi:MAG: hypothetical protein EOO30_21585 [Comamonadaceae bacterium]|nr:MAG: hypothetical protein EOO30_21585 [Comamonadaceae bacterium]
MTHISLSRALLLAGVVAAAGVAQAQTYDVPQQAGEASTMTHGAPNLVTDNQHSTHVMGAGPMVVYGAVPPSYGPDTVVTYIDRPEVVSRTSSAATFNVPSRAGEASTMTGGAPNMVTDNSRVIMQSDHPVLIVN